MTKRDEFRKKPMETVVDTSIFVGVVFEENDAIEALKQCKGILILPEKVLKEASDRLHDRGIHGGVVLRPLTLPGKMWQGWRKGLKPKIELGFPVPKELSEVDREVLETALSLSGKGRITCVLHKDPRHFGLVKESMRAKNVFVLDSIEYLDP